MKTNEHMVNGVADVIANYDPRRDSLEAAARKAIQAALDASPLPVVEKQMRLTIADNTAGYARQALAEHWLSMLNADAPESTGPLPRDFDAEMALIAADAERKRRAAAWTEGVCDDGAAILRDGVPVSISDLLSHLNAQPQPRPNADLREMALWVAREVRVKLVQDVEGAACLNELIAAAEREGR